MPKTDRKKILVADDSEVFRELGSTFLARLGTILTASTGSEAIEIARRELPAVMIVDFDMPDMCGDNLCRAVKADRDLHGTPVLLVTSGRCAEDHARAVRAHADDVLMKPLNRIQLGLSVSRLLSEERHLALTRVPLEEDVRVRLVRNEACSWGVMRDVSRGGIFVESFGRLPIDTEIGLDFRLPNARRPLRPTAQVMWAGPHPKSRAPGMGLRFLALDRPSTHQIDSFVHQFTSPRSGKLAATAVTS
ncbi:MAG: response regulator [Deltaproteobacteria bacterium]|nr:response regulator [Deltaproteobacteria bacterium]